MERLRTVNAVTLPTILLVGIAPDLLPMCQAAATAARAFMEATDVANAATMAARCRPLVIVVDEDLYEFDPAEFDALARDVRGKIVTLPTGGVLASDLETMFVAAAQQAREGRGAFEG